MDMGSSRCHADVDVRACRCPTCEGGHNSRAASRALATLRPRLTARRAVQGDCAAPFQGGSAGPPVGDLAPRQCVLSLTARLVDLSNHAPGLWLDNLALRFTGTTENFSLVDSGASSAAASTGAGALWLTGVTVAGGGLAQGVLVSGTTLFASGALPSCACAACGRRTVRFVTYTAAAGAPCKDCSRNGA